jgi:diguanylate cyclase (GGDEF)-like protein
LVIAITILIIFLMAGNVFVSVFNARGNIFQQIQVHAEDTATSLGLTISHVAQDKDEAQIGSFIDVVFDRGYYREISYKSLSGDMNITKKQPIEVEGVPSWFIEIMDLPEPSGHSEVISGWFRLGTVDVISHTGYAYRDLWRMFNEQLWLFMVTAVLSYGLAGIGLKFLLRPLRKVEIQAEAICRREFPIQDSLPRTPELKRMVMAMNRMVKKIQAMFQEQVELTEALHRQAYLDPVTQLSNRRDFDSRMDAFLKSERGGSSGIMLLLQVSGLQGLNERNGRDAGDQCLKELAAVLVDSFSVAEHAILSRRGGADLCVFAPIVSQDESQSLIEKMFTKMQEISWFIDDEKLSVHVGVVFSGQVMLGNGLLEEADLALRQAQHQGKNSVQWANNISVDGSARSASEWKAFLHDAVAKRMFSFQLQPVFGVDGKTVLHQEVLCRLNDGDQLLSAGVFLPMAERFNMLSVIDMLMIELLSDHALTHSNGKLCINISPRSIADSNFVSWVKEFLAAHNEFANNLILELPEQALVASEVDVRAFAEMIAEQGASLSLDHFGASASAFHYLQSLPMSVLKIDRCFVQGIDGSPDNQFFVKSLLQISHSCDLVLLAEGVETEDEWQSLLNVGVDGGQGYFLGKPQSPTV